jgi:glutamate--cysteine ligase
MDEPQLLFLKAFLVFCLLHESPRINAAEQAHIDYNELAAAHHGRDPQLRLRRDDGEILLRDWALELLDAMAGVCAVLDGSDAARPYSAALAAEREKVLDPERTPSARMLREMRAAGEGFFQYAMRLSRQHQAWFAKLELSAERQALFEQLAQRSQREQQELEAASSEPFARYLERYFAQPV